jgi:hypothetical protein
LPQPRKAREMSNKKLELEFARGYVIACCNLSNLHREPSMARDIFLELGVTKAEIEKMDLSEHDLEAIKEMNEAGGAELLDGLTVCLYGKRA